MHMQEQLPLRPGGLNLTKQAASFAGLTSASRVLDIGCGRGASLTYLHREYGCPVTGIDCSVTALEAAGKLFSCDQETFPDRMNHCDPAASVNLLLTDASALPLPDAFFDFVMMECTLTLFDEPMKALSEAARVLSPGGWLYVSALCQKNPSASDQIVTNGLLHTDLFCGSLHALGFEKSSFCISDQTPALIQFVADMIFQHGSLDAYFKKASLQTDGCIFNCAIAPKETGYVAIWAKRTS